MCGIVGIAGLNRRAIEPFAVKRMCDALAHRGPDDAGYALFRTPTNGDDGGYWAEFSDEAFAHRSPHLPVFGGTHFREETSAVKFQLALGHRRLSIVDLSPQGHQPMAGPDRRYWVSFNGEIYNYRELREELQSLGHVFRTRSDTEVLLHLWARYGRDCLKRLDGMFALAMYDGRRGELTLARDRFGVKPLYYAATADQLAFGSEIKSILASGTIRAELSPASVAEYLTFQNMLGAETLFRGVRLLGPGESLTVELARATPPAVERYHRLSWRVDADMTQEEAVRGTAERFGDAVRRQMIGDVEIGSYLSGGMDSGSITAVASQNVSRLLTFTVGFDLTNVSGIEQGFDERRDAEKLSYLFQTEHYDVVLHSGDMPAAMEQLTWHIDDPRVGMCHQNWYAAKLAGRFVKVCLSGAGGDELFGGYPWRYRQGINAASFAEFDDAYFRYWHRLLPHGELAGVFSDELRAQSATVEARFRDCMRDAPEFDPRLSTTDNMLQRAMYFEFNTFLQGLLGTEDRISMAHGLETRTPFLDNSLAEWACRMPPSFKVSPPVASASPAGAHLTTAEGKRVLRQAMSSYLPREFTEQRKQGFSPPDENWYRGPSMDYIRSILDDSRVRRRPWFQPGVVKSCLQEHVEGRRNHRLLIWSVLSLEWLERHYLDGSSNVGRDHILRVA